MRSVLALESMLGEGTPCVTLRRFLLVTHISMGQQEGIDPGSRSTSRSPLMQRDPSVKLLLPRSVIECIRIVSKCCLMHKRLFVVRDISSFREPCGSRTASSVSAGTAPNWLALCWPPASRAKCSGDTLPRCLCPPLLPLLTEMLPRRPQRWMRRQLTPQK